jgi:two-component system, sensor histidine kinase
MIQRRPDLAVLFAVLIGTLAVVGAYVGDLIVSRERELTLGERRVEHFGIMIGEHTARSFESVDILLREIATDLSEDLHDWSNWQPSQGWSYLATRHSNTLPQLRDLILFDHEGQQRYISTYFPTPNINVRDRPYFATLEGGQKSTTFGPYIGRNSGRYTYALARRIDNKQGGFAGIVFAAIEPGYFQDFCWSNRLADDFEAVIINAREQIVATCRPTDLSKQSPTLGAAARDVLYGGKLHGWLPTAGVMRNQGLIASLSPVPGFSDLRVLTVLPEATLLAGWRLRAEQLGALVTVVALLLLLGAWLARRQVLKMLAMSSELASSHEQLADRITEATNELAAQKDAAERANRAKSRFLAAASHDLRQPMHALALFAADLQRQVHHGKTDQLEHLSGQIAASIHLLGEMLDSLLDISRLDVAGINPQIRAFALQPLFERLAAAFRRSAVDHSQTLIFRPTGLWVDSDSQMLERMLANLLSNALRYTPNGGRILVAARQRGPDVLIEVRDNGRGIASEDQAAIFTEFYQVGNPAREHSKGLGLGLSIIDRLARALKIEVRLRSASGRGTVFGLLLRARPVAGTISPAPAGNAVAIHFIGAGDALQAAMGLVRSWDYAVSWQPSGAAPLPEFRCPMIVVTLASLAGVVRAINLMTTPMIALVDLPEATMPDGVFTLSLPLRPAKLRALLGQIQKTLPQSMP